MSENNVVLRFDNLTFGYSEKKKLLEEASFTLRKGKKVTIMGQNGAGKSSLLKLITGENKPMEGRVILDESSKVAIAKQVFTLEEKKLKLRDYMALAFKEVPYNLDKQIATVMQEVGLENYDLQREIKTYSGGQQARILLAYALIQDPDILLLDEPTNNLDEEGINALTMFLIMYDKTCLVISHDAEFLNSFTDGVLYVNVYTKKVEQYSGDYLTVVKEIEDRVERERQQNARAERQIQDQKDKIGFFANKGGKMRKLASKLRDQVEEAEQSKVEVRKDDRTILNFKINCQEELSSEFVTLPFLSVVEKGEVIHKKADLGLRKGDHIQFSGPNGIGKTTLLNNIVHKNVEGMSIAENLKIGYYTQDFHNLDFEKDVRISLLEAMDIGDLKIVESKDEEYMRKTAAGFLITSELMNNKIGDLSEGQKGLLAFAHIVLQNPGLLILDEPTNHINFRHVPIIAKALDNFEGAMILVSHVPDFVSQIKIDKIIELDKLK
jgi:ATPase subunit of ABC transporter with duplicated ATPase domains